MLEPSTEAAPPSPVATVVARKKVIGKFIKIKNNLRQMVPLNIRNASGVEVGIEIPAYGVRRWPDIDDLGPDIKIKTRRKYLSILR